jgi:hypothetical protein
MIGRQRSRYIVRGRRAGRGGGGLVAWAALMTSILAVVMSATGLAGAVTGHTAKATKKAKASTKYAPLSRGKIPTKYFPTVPHARNADELGGQSASSFTPSCAPTTVDLGSWCLMAAPYPLTNDQLGKNDYFFATQACVQMGGYLPTAAQLIGAANRVKLESVIHDSQLTATIPIDSSQGLKDQREMSATLVTTAAGSDAAGSEGVSVGSTGNPRVGEQNPTPYPATPQPETLQYATVYDNYNHGGFAGSEPVSKPENFRCAFDKTQGAAQQGNG